MSFETFGYSSVDLSMKDSLENQLTATLYTLKVTVDGEEVTRTLSIGQLVMAICLDRATELEEDIVSKLAALATTTEQLEALTELEEKLVAQEEASSSSSYSEITSDFAITYDGTTYKSSTTMLSALGITTSGATWSDVISEVESKMDSLNSLSQTTLIDIQSLTSKRDDTYNLVSNVLKSFYTEMLGNVNNM